MWKFAAGVKCNIELDFLFLLLSFLNFPPSNWLLLCEYAKTAVRAKASHVRKKMTQQSRFEERPLASNKDQRLRQCREKASRRFS